MLQNFFRLTFMYLNIYSLKKSDTHPVDTGRYTYFKLLCKTLKFIDKIDKEKYISILMRIFFYEEYKKIRNDDIQPLRDFVIKSSDDITHEINCELKTVNKIISESLSEEHKTLLGMYLSNYTYKEMAEYLKIPEHSVIYKICFMKKSLSDIFREI